MDIFMIVICLMSSAAAAYFVDLFMEIWDFFPVKEEVSTPLYITKEIH